MRRREALTCVAAVAGTAGCLGDASTFLDEGRDTPRPTEIVDWEHDTDVSVQGTVDTSDEPVIEVDREESAVTVEGVAAYGSSNCGYLAFPEPTYDAEASRLHVRVVDRIDQSSGVGCGDDLAGESYRVGVWFDDGLPAEVVAEETEFSIRVTRTIE